MELEDEIRSLAEGILAGDQFLIDVVLSSKKGPRKITVIVDGDHGIGIDDCADISRRLSEALDKLSMPDDRYLLEVTTPGVDQPLKLRRQYVKNVGRNVRVLGPTGVIEGLLTAVNEQSISVSVETGKGKNRSTRIEDIPMSAIDKMFVMISFK